jgi:hypothetical protein
MKKFRNNIVLSQHNNNDRSCECVSYTYNCSSLRLNIPGPLDAGAGAVGQSDSNEG